jgi:hypothetical protein
MRPLIAAFAAALLGTVALTCADTHKHSAPGRAYRPNAGDFARGTGVPESPVSVRNLGDDHDGDNDNALVRSFGHEASARDKRAVIALVKRYYAAAYSDTGAMACSLIYSPFAKAVAHDYGRAPGPAALRGNTCAVVLSKLFKQERHRIIADIKATVSTVHTRGNDGWVMLYYSNSEPERYLPVERERDIWKLSALLDSRLP